MKIGVAVRSTTSPAGVRLCEGHDDRAAMRRRINPDRLMVPGSVGQLVAHPLLAHLRTLEAQMTKLESECGFTPAARAWLGHAEVRRAASKLDELAARRRSRGSADGPA